MLGNFHSVSKIKITEYYDITNKKRTKAKTLLRRCMTKEEFSSMLISYFPKLFDKLSPDYGYNKRVKILLSTNNNDRIISVIEEHYPDVIDRYNLT